MTIIESVFQGMFTGFCSYLGSRVAIKTHKHLKKKKISSLKKYMRKRIL